MTSVVLDASAVMALLCRKPGMEAVEARLAGAAISVVSYADILQQGVELGGSVPDIRNSLELLQLAVAPFDAEQAVLAASLGEKAKLSFSERCTIALGLQLGWPIVTTHREWSKLSLAVAVEVI